MCVYIYIYIYIYIYTHTAPLTADQLFVGLFGFVDETLSLDQICDDEDVFSDTVFFCPGLAGCNWLT